MLPPAGGWPELARPSLARLLRPAGSGLAALYPDRMSQAVSESREPPLLEEQTARANADTLRRLGGQHGISELRFASPGLLVAHVDDDRDMIDMADFMADVISELDRYAEIIDDVVLTRPDIGDELIAARPL